MDDCLRMGLTAGKDEGQNRAMRLTFGFGQVPLLAIFFPLQPALAAAVALLGAVARHAAFALGRFCLLMETSPDGGGFAAIGLLQQFRIFVSRHRGYAGTENCPRLRGSALPLLGASCGGQRCRPMQRRLSIERLREVSG